MSAERPEESDKMGTDIPAFGDAGSVHSSLSMAPGDVVLVCSSP